MGEVARLARVTVRTLHHYDEIGLLTPSDRSGAGYRRYGEADLDRLRSILAYRELGLALEDIAAILDDPGTDALGQLHRQRALLTRRVERLQAVIAAVNREMEALTMQIKLTPEERFEVFGDFDPAEHAEEAERRWGHADAYRESARRAGSYGKSDWEAIKAEGEAIERRLAAALAAGVAPDSAEAMDAAEEHRAHIARWFYACSPEMHRNLALMYVEDERFAAHYEDVAPGLAAYVGAAAAANADRREGAA